MEREFEIKLSPEIRAGIARAEAEIAKAFEKMGADAAEKAEAMNEVIRDWSGKYFGKFR